MRHYRRTYSGSIRMKTIMFRILFVILAAAVITFSSIFLGTYLQKKVDAAEAALNTAEPSRDQVTSRPVRSDSAASAREVSAAGLKLRNYHTEDAVVAAVNALAEHYDTLIVHLGSSDGSLLYTSPALCSRLRIAAPKEDAELALIRSALTAAKSKNLYLCAVMDTSFGLLDRGTDEQIDSTLFSELASFGVDEILLTNTVLDPENIPEDDLADYLAGCMTRLDGSCEIGVLLDDEVFRNFNNAHAIQTIASAADFIGIDMTCYETITPDALYEQMKDTITSLYGSFSIYNMRVVLSTSDNDLLAAQVQAVRDSNLSLCLTDNVLPDALSYTNRILPADEPEEVPAEETTAGVPPESNPYAVGLAEEPEPSEPDSAEEIPSEEDLSGDGSVGDSWYYDENGNRIRPWY